MTHHQTRKTHCPNNHPYTPITRNAQLRALGNGVVPQQAAEAVRFALTVGAS